MVVNLSGARADRINNLNYMATGRALTNASFFPPALHKGPLHYNPTRAGLLLTSSGGHEVEVFLRHGAPWQSLTTQVGYSVYSAEGSSPHNTGPRWGNQRPQETDADIAMRPWCCRNNWVILNRYITLHITYWSGVTECVILQSCIHSSTGFRAEIPCWN